VGGLLPEILDQSDRVGTKSHNSLHSHSLGGATIVCLFWYCVIVFYLILILSFLFSGELISIPKFFESFIYKFYFILFLHRV